MTRGNHVVLVLDDDPSILSGLERLLTAHGYSVRLHSEPDDFFHVGMPEVPACLLLDNQLGDGMTGVQVHAELQRRGWNIPTVFVTAHWNVQTVVNAMRDGADGFLTKPYNPADLLDAVAQAQGNGCAPGVLGIGVGGDRAAGAELAVLRAIAWEQRGR